MSVVTSQQPVGNVCPRCGRPLSDPGSCSACLPAPAPASSGSTPTVALAAGNGSPDDLATLSPVTHGKKPEESGTGGPVLPQVAGYEILGVLGRGGMGVVYQANQVALKRTVALKMILSGSHAGPQELARFRSEAESVARLQHPHIVQVYEVGEADGHPFCALEFVSGGSLAQKLDGTPQPARSSAALVRTLAEAVHAAHQKGIVHRDLKPANVLLTEDGQPKITDFGLAKQLDAPTGPTASGAVLGTPSYMAPEQALGQISRIGPCTDIYALGALLYELLTGRPPFKGETALDTILQAAQGEPVPPRRLQPKVPRGRGRRGGQRTRSHRLTSLWGSPHKASSGSLLSSRGRSRR